MTGQRDRPGLLALPNVSPPTVPSMGLFRLRPASRRSTRFAVVGSCLFFAGAVLGLAVGVGKLHRSLTVDSGETERTCVELLLTGDQDGPMVRLTDAEVHQPPDWSEPDVRIEWTGPLANTSFAKAAQGWMTDPRSKPVLDRLTRGHVTPAGVGGDPRQSPLRLGWGRATAEQAQQQLQNDGTLLVHATVDRLQPRLIRWAEKLSLPLPTGWEESAETPSLTLYPASLVDPVWVSLVWVSVSLIAMSVGLVMCGASRLGRWALLCPTGAILGLAGMPLRSGRGGRATRLLYRIAGLALLAIAYHWMLQRGGLSGHPTDTGYQLGGFVLASGGFAALLGAFLHGRAEKNAAAIDATEYDGRSPSAGYQALSPPAKAAPVASYKTNAANQDTPREIQAAAAKSGLLVLAKSYSDARLSVAHEAVDVPEVVDQAQALEAANFESPLSIQIIRDHVTSYATLQIGCRRLVLAKTEWNEGMLQLNMISCMTDGHMVLTSNAADTASDQPLTHQSATLSDVPTDDAVALLQEHLRLIEEVAEKRQQSVVELESAEWRDVIHCAERCRADVLHHCGEAHYDISEMGYGRFSFPPHPVAVPLNSQA